MYVFMRLCECMPCILRGQKRVLYALELKLENSSELPQCGYQEVNSALGSLEEQEAIIILGTHTLFETKSLTWAWNS